MRVWARYTNNDGTKSWTAVETDPVTGDNSKCYLVALCQTLLLNLNESPFWSSLGIPAQQSVEQQVPPDYYIGRIQQFYSQFFASLIVARAGINPPTYNISVITLAGAKINFNLPTTAAPPNQIPR